MNLDISIYLGRTIDYTTIEEGAQPRCMGAPVDCCPEPKRRRPGSASEPCVRVSNSHGASITWRLSRAPIKTFDFSSRLYIMAVAME